MSTMPWFLVDPAWDETIRWLDELDVSLRAWSRGTSSAQALIGIDRGMSAIVAGSATANARLNVNRMIPAGQAPSHGTSSASGALGFYEDMRVRIDGTSTATVSGMIVGSAEGLQGAVVTGTSTARATIYVDTSNRPPSGEPGEGIGDPTDPDTGRGIGRRAFMRSSGRVNGG